MRHNSSQIVEVYCGILFLSPSEPVLRVQDHPALLRNNKCEIEIKKRIVYFIKTSFC